MASETDRTSVARPPAHRVASTPLADLRGEATKCSRCGFCQPTCPIYRVTGREAHVARGKNFLFRKMAEGTLSVEPDFREAFDNCLLCRACTANCFPEVRTDSLVIAFREAYAARWGRPRVQRLLFRTLLPRPALVRAAFYATWRSGAPRVARAAGRGGVLEMLNPKMNMAARLVADSPLPFLRDRLQHMELRPRKRSLRVGYWLSCGYNYMLPEVGVDTVRVLLALGAEVVPLENNCCGLPVLGYGDRAAARMLAKRNLWRLRRFSELDYVVSECGSCSSHLKEYGALLAEDEECATSAKALSERTRSFSELVVELGGELPLRQLQRRVTYHDPCHMTARYQGVTEQPRALIKSIPGVAFSELDESDSCCGAAGSYNVLHPDISSGILQRKARKIAESEAELVVTECPSCLMQLSLGAREHAPQVTVLGISQLLAGALES